MKFRLSLLSILLMALVFVLGACKKEEDKGPADVDYSDIDKSLIENYISANNLTGFTNDSSGVYVSITRPGTGPLATKGQTIITKYTGSTLDGQVFDQTKESTIGFPFELGSTDPLKKVIRGWNDAFSQLNKGAKAILLIESKKAYGSTSTGNIPPNSVLRFDVEVINIKPKTK